MYSHVYNLTPFRNIHYNNIFHNEQIANLVVEFPTSNECPEPRLQCCRREEPETPRWQWWESVIEQLGNNCKHIYICISRYMMYI